MKDCGTSGVIYTRRESICLRFLQSIFSNEHQKVPPVYHQQKCLINGICGASGIKSNYFGPTIPRKLKDFDKLGKKMIKCKKVFQ